jgi:hypothetical protein
MALIRCSEEARLWLNEKAYKDREPVSIVLDRIIFGGKGAKIAGGDAKAKAGSGGSKPKKSRKRSAEPKGFIDEVNEFFSK